MLLLSPRLPTALLTSDRRMSADCIQAMRMVDPKLNGFQSLPVPNNDLDRALSVPTDERLFAIGNAMIDHGMWHPPSLAPTVPCAPPPPSPIPFRPASGPAPRDATRACPRDPTRTPGYTVDRIHDLTKIDKWFLHKLDNIVQTRKEIQAAGALDKVPTATIKVAKQQGFSDPQIAQLVGRCASRAACLLVRDPPTYQERTGVVPPRSTELSVRAHRKALGITPFAKQIDTLAAEFPAATNYLYTTYNATVSDVPFAAPGQGGVLVLGSGVYRIGSSVEFDWGAVSCIRRCVPGFSLPRAVGRSGAKRWRRPCMHVDLLGGNRQPPSPWEKDGHAQLQS